MNRLSMVIFLAIGVLPILLFSTSTLAVNHIESPNTKDNQASLSASSLIYKNGLINANINNAPIGKILDELKAKTGTRISIYDTSILNSRLSVTLKEIPLVKTIRIILEGLSYALYPLDDTFVVIVLSTVPGTVMSHRRVTSEPAITGQPKSLDEFQPIKMEERWLDLDHTEERSTEDSEQFMIERRHQEAVVQRAYDAISSEHEHLIKKR